MMILRSFVCLLGAALFSIQALPNDQRTLSDSFRDSVRQGLKEAGCLDIETLARKVQSKNPQEVQQAQACIQFEKRLEAPALQGISPSGQEPPANDQQTGQVMN